jgi:outer membrane protein
MLSLVGVLAGLSFATPSRAETLLEVYRLALDNDPRYRAARAEARAASTAIDQARAGFLPTVKLDVERTETRQEVLRSQNPIFGTGSTTFATDNETLSVTQPIFRKDVIERLKQAQAVVRQASYTVLAAQHDLMLRTAAAYLVVLAATDSLRLARAEREAVGRALDLARERLKMGLGTIVSEHDAAARFAVTQARELDAEYRLRDARQGLREITGRTIEQTQSLRQEARLESPQPPVVERWVEAALAQNMGLRARTEAVEVARQEVERQRGAYWPSFNLVWSHNRRDAGSTLFGGGSKVETADLTLRLTVPIFEGGLTQAVTEEAAHRYQKSLEDLEQERRSVERATRGAYEGTLVGESLIRALRQSVVSQQSALQAKEEGYKSGLFTLLPVLDAQRDLYLAMRDLAQARYEHLLTRLKLKQAAGSLSEADLELIAAALQ